MKLLNTLIALALALCATLAYPADADPPGVAGRLNYISGPVSFAPAQAKEEWAVAELNHPITTGDRLWTDTGGRAELHVGSLAVRMDAQTSLDVLALDDRRIQLRLAQGTMNLRVRRLSSDRLLEIATPGGAVVVKQPGTYRVSVEPSGAATLVTVRGSLAEVFTGKSSFLVRANQQATISGERQDLSAAPPPDEFDRWAATRDRREDRVVSTRYVPEEMTGYEDLDEHGKWETVGQYGPVWVPSSVPTGWAPYRHGRWVWVAPWGWTWVDRAPWGFAPFHYGRWVHHGNRWGWAPGRRVARPVYAPALVAFVGGSNWSVSVGAGSALAVGWVPLGWREPYRPWYRSSPNHFRNVNVTHVTNVTNINNTRNIRYANRNAGATVVSRENFVSRRAADRAALQVNPKALASASVTRGAPVEAPTRASLAASERGKQPPSTVRTRETVTVNPPPGAARRDRQEARKDKQEARKDKQEARAASAGDDESPRVRVVDRAKRVELKPSVAQATGTAAGAQAPATAEQRTPRAPLSQGSGGERAQEKAKSQAADSNKSERAQEKSRSQAAESKKSERAQEKAAEQAARRAPAPPPDVSQRPTFDKENRQSGSRGDTPEAKREQRQSERPERREKAPDAAPRAPAVSQQREEAAERAQQQRAQRQAQEQQAQRQRETQRERAAQRAQDGQAQEQQRRRQQEAQQQQKEQQKERRQQQQREQKERQRD